ncbi:ATP-binding protein [Methanospirillum stamsii]|nr:hybrid sensor histidine kinase/response regulator [Methanospirillum stamsii]
MTSIPEYLSEISDEEKFHILLVISSKPIGAVTKKYLEMPSLLHVHVCPTGREAIDIVNKESFDLILSDYDLDDTDAINLHLNLQQSGINIPFQLFNITDRDREILTTFAQNPTDESSIKNDINIIFNELSQKIAQSIELFRTRNRLELYTRHLEELVEERTRQLQEAQRYAVIGEVATMIGHDMRNPLQVITNMQYILDSALNKMSPEEHSILMKYGIRDIFNRIGGEILYLNKIISDLQDYSRVITPEREITNLEPLFEDLILKLSPPDSITVIKEIESGIRIRVDRLLFMKVMENIITNAIQAMQKGGVLTVKAGLKSDNISIFISDTGIGIPEGVKARIFDPLYTTKPKGTGLGLAVCKRLIEAQGGTISLKETSSKGTAFEVNLPV